jgi:hypothetical protein
MATHDRTGIGATQRPRRRRGHFGRHDAEPTAEPTAPVGTASAAAGLERGGGAPRREIRRRARGDRRPLAGDLAVGSRLQRRRREVAPDRIWRDRHRAGARPRRRGRPRSVAGRRHRAQRRVALRLGHLARRLGVGVVERRHPRRHRLPARAVEHEDGSHASPRAGRRLTPRRDRHVRAWRPRRARRHRRACHASAARDRNATRSRRERWVATTRTEWSSSLPRSPAARGSAGCPRTRPLL